MAPNRHLLLPAVFLLCATEFLQSGMVTFAAAPIMGEIGAGPEEFSVVAALYACVAVLAIAKQHWLIERIGWRDYLIGSAIVFVGGALLCAQADRVLPFAIGRVAMALGGGTLMVTARLLVNLQPQGPMRFTGVKVFASGLCSGLAAAPLLAALAVTSHGHALIFYLLAAVISLGTALAIACAPSYVPPEEFHSESDAGRLLLLAVSSFFLLYLLQRSYYDFYNDSLIVACFIGLAAIGLYAYFHIEHGHRAPLLRVREFLSRDYLLGIALFTIGYVILGANTYTIPIFIQRGLGYSWETTGLLQSIGLMSSVVAWLLMSSLLPRSPGLWKYLACGLLCLICFSVQMTRISPEAHVYTSVLPALLFNGGFIILTFATAAMQSFRHLLSRDHLFSHGYQLKAILAQLAIAFGISLATLLIQWRSTVQYDHIAIRIQEGSPAYTDHVATLAAAYASQGAGSASMSMALASIGQEVARQATLLASIEYFRALTWLSGAALAALLSFRLLPRHRKK